MFFYRLLFGVYPYICLFTFIFGSFVRLAFHPYSVTAKSSQFLDKKKSKALIIALIVFHIGILTILGGHFLGFLTPRGVFALLGITDEAHAKFAEVSGGIAGSFTFFALIYLILRRFLNNRVSIKSTLGDKLILLVLFTQLVLGMLTIILKHPMNEGDKIASLSKYFQGIVTLNFKVYGYIIKMPLITKLHIILGWTLFLLFPFTRLIHVMVAPLHYLVRRGYQIVRQK